MRRLVLLLSVAPLAACYRDPSAENPYYPSYYHNYRPLPPAYYLPSERAPSPFERPSSVPPGPAYSPNNCGTPDEPKPCPPRPYYPANRQ